MTVRVAQLTDPHLRAGPGDLGSGQALAAAVGAIAALDPAPDAVLLTGDLTETGDPRAYARLRELIAPLTMPVHPIPGNHDDRDALRAAFADHPGVAAAAPHIHYATACGPLRLVLCDTQRPGHDGGSLDEARRAWLAATLDEQPDVPALVAMHHPPVASGIGEFDAIGLPDGDRDALAALLRERPWVVGVTAGHIHRVIAGTVGGVPVTVAPSAWRQAQLDLGPGGRAVLGDDPPGYLLHLLGDDRALVSHAVFLTEATGG